MGVELNLAYKREFIPHDLFYKYANIKNLLMSRSICFKGPSRSIQFSSETWKFYSSFCLTISTFINYISSSMLEYGVFKSPRS
jgi:hypothetical protein